MREFITYTTENYKHITLRLFPFFLRIYYYNLIKINT